MKYLLLLLFSVLFVTTQVRAQSEERLIEELNQRILTSQQELTLLTNQIVADRTALSRKLDQQQSTVIELRERISSLQRVADENLLSYEKLNERIQQWERQNSYQQQLVFSFVSNTQFPVPQTSEKTLSFDLQSFNERVLQQLKPSWTETSAVSEDGTLGSYQVLSLGPVKIGYSPETSRGGPVVESDETVPLVLTQVPNEETQTGIGQLFQQGTGMLVLDPTLGNAYQLIGQESDLVSHIKKGGVWAYPILAFGVLAIIAAIFKVVQIVRLPSINVTLADSLVALFKQYSVSSNELNTQFEKIKSKTKGLQADLLDIAIDTPVSQLRDELLVAKLVESKNKVERYIGVISICAGVAPLLGLLGTVTGMISTFTMMTVFGTGEASTVSGGISEALVTTELGLVVAIPALIVSALLHRSAKSYGTKLETDAIKLSKVEFGEVYA